MISSETLFRHAKDALGNLYDPVHLQTHPLLDILAVAPRPGQTMGEALRALLWDTIERLRPPESITANRPEWLSYGLLLMHYVHAMDRPTVCRELGLSEASFYRRQRAAVEAMTSLLLQQCRPDISERGRGVSIAEPISPTQRAKEEALRLARRSTSQPINLSLLMRDVERTVQNLAQERHTVVRLDVAADLPVVWGDRVILEQVVLSILTDCIHAADPEGLELKVFCGDGLVVWKLLVSVSTEPDIVWQEMPGIKLSQELLEELYGGELWVEGVEPNRLRIRWALPVTMPKSILIIDDDEDTTALYQRFLAGEGFLVRVSRGEEPLDALLAQGRPDIIILDVLLPGTGGWGMLESLKVRPETAGIPVVVCSVLSQPQLALSLGASEVLRKPTERGALLRALRAALQPNSQDEQHLE